MQTLDQFIAEIENTFSNYAETGDIDKISIKGWVISCLRGFGKNICDLRETVVEVENSKALLPENFKSLHLALRVDPIEDEHHHHTHNFAYKQYIINPIRWDSISQEYIANNCDTKIVTEKLFLHNHHHLHCHPTMLSLVKGMQKDTVDVDCLNIHPSIRNIHPDKISITNRTINANFRKGRVYVMYNSLPSDEDGEVAIPIITTGDILAYIENYVKIKIAESLIINSKNPQGLLSLMPMWKQDTRILKIKAESEANFNGLNNEWYLKLAEKNRKARNRYNLPRF
jgi:hypothetical protein